VQDLLFCVPFAFHAPPSVLLDLQSDWHRKQGQGHREYATLARMGRKGKKIAFGWYGGKYSHLDWLLPLLPSATHYCEPFGGSAAVLINRQPSPVETYNDLDSEVVNFFKVLRDHPDELIRQIGLTPFSREELRSASHESTVGLTEVERARRFFVRARQVRTGLAQTASEGRWAHCLLTSRANMAGAVSRWLGSVEGLSEIVQRLLRVQIENAPAVEVIRRYDSPETLFYCDPPYIHESRGDKKAYIHEMTDEQHAELAEALHKVKGKVAISGYHSKLMDDLYRDWDFIESNERIIHSTKDSRTEVLWVNYNLEEIQQGNAISQKQIFGDYYDKV
ncbi:DNA adenine methylase, partial [Deinococcus ficus]|uniref:DNA adenine methylase n=1 Tax=Deinococcus ficus TaxID=317577 RepID=UPI001E52B339